MDVGIKNFRDKFNNGVITFGKAFKIGFFIALIASTFYVITWLFDYYLFFPDFIEVYTAHSIEKLKASGISQVELQQKMTEFDDFKKMYKNPFFVIIMTYAEILPLGIVVSLICAAILKKKNPDSSLA